VRNGDHTLPWPMTRLGMVFPSHLSIHLLSASTCRSLTSSGVT
jgi:hypothetical protein